MSKKINFQKIGVTGSCIAASFYFSPNPENALYSGVVNVGSQLVYDLFSSVSESINKDNSQISKKIFLDILKGSFENLFNDWDKNPIHTPIEKEAYENFKWQVESGLNKPIENGFKPLFTFETQDKYKQQILKGKDFTTLLLQEFLEAELAELSKEFNSFFIDNFKYYFNQQSEITVIQNEENKTWFQKKSFEAILSNQSTLLNITGSSNVLLKELSKKIEDFFLTYQSKTSITGKVLSNFIPVNEKKVIGRSKEINKIHEIINNEYTVLLLNGIGGIGKTTLATLYVQTHKDEYDNLVWINAAQGIYKGFVSDTTLSYNLGLTGTIQQLQEQQPDNFEEKGAELLLNTLLDKTNGLLIIDNEQQEQSTVDEVRNKLQGSGNWKILITARETLTDIEPYKVDVLDEGDAQELFYQHYTKEQNDALVDEINELLLRHTLMVELMARVAQNRDDYTLIQLKSDLETTKLNFAKDDKIESNHWGTGTKKEKRLNAFLQAAFTIAEFEIQENDSEEQKAEKQQLQQLLTYWCLMPERNPIKLNWFCELCKITNEVKNETNTLFNQLVKTGWLQKDNEEYLMHPVIQQALRWQLQPQPKGIDNLVNGLRAKMRHHFYEKHTLIGAFHLQPYIKSLLDYFLSIQRFKKENYTKDWENISKLVNIFSLFFRHIGDIEKSLEFALKNIEINKQILNEKHPDLATSYGNIAMTYQIKGNLDNALKFALKTLTIHKEILDPKHIHLSITYSNISIIYNDKGNLDEALKFAFKALNIREEIMEPKHTGLANSYNNIAVIYQNKKDWEKALEFALKDLTIIEEVLKPKHPHLANSYGNIAMIYRGKEDLEKALEFALKNLNIFEEVLAPQHPDLANSYHNIASIYYDKKEYINAKKNIDKAVEIMEYNFPDGHPNLDNAKGWQKAIDEKLKGN